MPTPPAEPLPQPEVVVEPVVDEPPAAVQPEPEAEPEPVKIAAPPRLPPVAVVISGRQPAFLDVANALVDQLDDVEIYDLSDASRPPVSVLRSINDAEAGTVVAIGLRAARSSVSLAKSPVVFGQVFNHNEYGLLTENSRGVSPLAPLDAQLAAWTEADPDLKRIGIIVGEGHDLLIEEAKAAADRHSVQLHVKITRSDQETLYVFRRMAQDIDGFWLFPDNRVLSSRSLKEILDIAQRAQIAVAVPNESMLAIGGSISFESEASDIAATIARIVRKIHADGLNSIPPMNPLSAIRVVTRGDARVVQR